MLLMVSAGEPSGDLRAAELCSELSKRADIPCFGLGGDAMAGAGVELTAHLADYSVMGFSSVLASLGRLRALEKELKRQCLARRPDALLLVDYPGLNLRLAKWARTRGFRVVYYISPQFWAWGGWRLRGIARSVDLMITLFRFEADIYGRRGVRALWCGHPLVDSIPAPSPGGQALALLPGSRPDEVARLLPRMLDCVDLMRASGDTREVRVAVSRTVPRGLYEGAAQRRCSLVDGTAAALPGARAALVCSGTATLETALHGVPFVLMYRTSSLNYLLARLLVRGVDRICLASIAAGRSVARELVQGDATGEGAIEALAPLLADSAERVRAVEELDLVRKSLGPPGAAARAAEGVLAGLATEFRDT
ncbi:MAG: lipid-A-disaccharide synthase [Candidatus Fermentibacter sp.]|nr:lipid-A-disaccharide synthase [Candidatus Fermentibacter sp.]